MATAKSPYAAEAMDLTGGAAGEMDLTSAMPSSLSRSERTSSTCCGLSATPENIHKSSKYSFRRWTILEYSKAYMSREVTPRVLDVYSIHPQLSRVADRFIAAVRECSSSALKMSFFINYDTEDII
ncbi:hypothetical protein RJ639_019329 [Escallonia herrerae]|uniref:Uncharacterized protein n=1 Tax=Escallonia herrerae TaxID=1293975 RepID=A0AA88VBZ7_9ASTE|nr:hypothetical protein RJ639_019329 [Escallonia herrerae]